MTVTIETAGVGAPESAFEGASHMKPILSLSIAALATVFISQPLSAREHQKPMMRSDSVTRSDTMRSSPRVSTSRDRDAGPRFRTMDRERTPIAERDMRMRHPSPSIAFGGSSAAERDRFQTRERERLDHRDHRAHVRSRPSFEVYRGWDRNRIYTWNNHRWHWRGGDWVIVEPSVTVSTAVPLDSPSLAASVQQRLSARGYNPGPADGVIGPQTRDAISDFQEDHGMAPTGRIDTPLLRALDL